MTSAQVVKTSVTVNNNSPIQDYVHLDDHIQPTYEMTPGFKPFTEHLVLKTIPESMQSRVCFSVILLSDMLIIIISIKMQFKS